MSLILTNIGNRLNKKEKKLGDNTLKLIDNIPKDPKQAEKWFVDNNSWIYGDMYLLNYFNNDKIIYPTIYNLKLDIINCDKKYGEFKYPSDGTNLITYDFYGKINNCGTKASIVKDTGFIELTKQIIQKKIQGSDIILSKYNVFNDENIKKSYSVLKSDKEFLCMLSKRIGEEKKILSKLYHYIHG